MFYYRIIWNEVVILVCANLNVERTVVFFYIIQVLLLFRCFDRCCVNPLHRHYIIAFKT